jgi:hypothetical protein
MITALDFGRIIHDGSTPFGIVEREAIIKKLREIADRIEKEERPRLVLQKAYSVEQAESDEYTSTILMLEFVELSARAPKGTRLWGNDSSFPVEVKT